MRSHTIVIAICLALSVSFARAETCSSPAFAVNGLHLDTQAVDGTLARKAALETATTDAFQIVTKRLLLPSQPAAAQLPPPVSVWYPTLVTTRHFLLTPLSTPDCGDG